jgi:imidazolonepropionase-like amidohydrolase
VALSPLTRRSPTVVLVTMIMAVGVLTPTDARGPARARSRFASAPALAASPGLQSIPLVVTGASLIDGNGGPPLRDAVVVIVDGRITSAGPRGSVSLPPAATRIDAAGKYIVPGLIDTNVHLSLYGGTAERYETLVRYYARERDIVLEAAQIQLKHGVTTVRDSYGLLPPLVEIRDAIAAGRHVGPRILAAGNIVGWGGPYSVSFSLIREQALTLFQEQVNDDISQGVGEDLVDMDPEELRTAIRKYLDKGPDFIKYGGTAHFARPSFIGFSPEAQKIIVEEAHQRNKVAETHATTADGLRLAIDAGIDLIQHPEMLGSRPLPDALVQAIVQKKIVCSMLVNTMTGDAWKKHLKDREEAEKKRSEQEKKGERPSRARTSAEARQREADEGVGLEMRRRNVQTLIKAGAVATIGTDNYWAAAPELSRTRKPEAQDHGIGSILAIEGLVELGMTPAEAIVAATKNGAIAARGIDQFGTIEAGKRADLLILDADPLADIRNLRKLSQVVRDGRLIDRDKLPEQRVLSRGSESSTSSSERRQ